MKICFIHVNGDNFLLNGLRWILKLTLNGFHSFDDFLKKRYINFDWCRIEHEHFQKNLRFTIKFLMNDFNATPPLSFGGHFKRNAKKRTKIVKRTSGRSKANVSGLLWQLFTNYRILTFNTMNLKIKVNEIFFVNSSGKFYCSLSQKD